MSHLEAEDTNEDANVNQTENFDLRTVSAVDLAQFLHEVRFEGDAPAALDYVNQVRGALSSSDDTKDAENTASTTSTSALVESLGEPLSNGATEVMCLQPRARFDVTFYTGGCLLVDKKGEPPICITTGSVQHVVIFPKPDDCRLSKITQAKRNQMTDTILLTLDTSSSVPLQYKKKSWSQICWQLPTTLPTDANDTDHSAAWMQLVCQSLGVPVDTHVTRIYNPAKDKSSRHRNVFASAEDKSSTTGGGLPFVPCYRGFQDGVLFPMETGILFTKPPYFWHRSGLQAIDCTGSNRYLTVTVAVDSAAASGAQPPPSTTEEFSNISRDEEQGMRNYVHNILIPAMQGDVELAGGDKSSIRSPNKGSRSPRKPKSPAVEEEEDEEDEDDENAGRGRKRKAATAANRINQRALTHNDDEEDEDEDDYDEEGDENEDGEGDDDDDDDEEEEDDEDYDD